MMYLCVIAVFASVQSNKKENKILSWFLKTRISGFGAWNNVD